MQPNTDPRIDEPTVGKVLLASRGFFKEQYWFWISILALLGFSLLFNLLYILSLTFLSRKLSIFLPFGYRNLKTRKKPANTISSFVIIFTAFSDSKSVLLNDDDDDRKNNTISEERLSDLDIAVNLHPGSTTSVDAPKRGMVLPFQALSLAFNHVSYYVDMPAVSFFLSFRKYILL